MAKNINQNNSFNVSSLDIFDKKNSKFDPLFSIMLPRYYDPPEYFCEPLYQFSYNLDSLQRYFEYTQRYIEELLKDSDLHLKKNKNIDQNTAEFFDFYGDMNSTDQIYFINNHLSNILSSLFCLLEKLVNDIADQIAVEKGIKMELPLKEMP